MTDGIQITLDDKGLTEAIKRYPDLSVYYLAQAGQECAKDIILPTVGLQSYPPATEANQPPTPYYIRGLGTQYKSRNNMKSENLGKQWVIENRGIDTVISNRAKYSPYVHGEEQSRVMARIGWRKLQEVAEEKLDRIARVYNAWVEKLLKDIGLSE